MPEISLSVRLMKAECTIIGINRREAYCEILNENIFVENIPWISFALIILKCNANSKNVDISIFQNEISQSKWRHG